MNIAPLSMLPLPGAADPAALAGDPARLAREFDAMVLRLMLGELGNSLGAGNELLGGMLAEQLATTVDLGLGATLVRSAMQEPKP
jgi:hypothetical protein